MEHRLQMTNVLSELTENQNRRRQRPTCEGRYINKRTNVLRELTKNHHLKQTCQGCGIGKIGTAALYSCCGWVFICEDACFQLYIDSIPYGCPG